MLNNMKIGPKLIGGFLIVAVIAAVIGTLGISELKAIDKADTKLYEKMAAPLGNLALMEASFHQFRVNLRDAIRANDPQVIEQKINRVAELNRILDENAQEYEKSILTEDGRKLFGEFVEQNKLFGADQEKIFEQARLNKDAEAWAMVDGHATIVAKAAQAALELMVAQKIKLAKETSDANSASASHATAIMIAVLIFGVLIAIALGVWLATSITGPLAKGVAMMQEMLKGHLGTRLKMTRKDEIGQLANAMDEFSEDLQKNVVATVIKIGEGDVSTDLKPKDNQDEITPAVMNTTVALRGLIAEAGMLRKAAVEGKLSTRGQAEKFKGGYKDIVQGVNDTLDAVIGPLNVAGEYIDRISKGDIPQKITDNYNGDFNEIKNNLNKCIEAVNRLVADAGMLSKAAVEGKLSTRADATKHEGDFRKIVQGVDDCLDAVIGPLNVAGEYIDRISKGDIPQKITDNYNGDFNEIKNNLNQLIGVANSLLKEADVLVAASKDGQLETRGNADQFAGGWRDLYKGINNILDAILIPIGEGNRVLAQVSAGKIDELITQTYKGDHEKMKQAINNVALVLQGLQKELGRLTVASREGQLSERGKADQFKGAYGEIVVGVNAMLDAILIPIGEGNRVLAQVSAGKIDELIAQTYKGDHEKMKQAINNVALVLQGLAKELGRLTVASREGQLSERGKSDQFKGAYGEIVGGVNAMLDAILVPIGEGNRILDQVSVGNLKERVEIACKGDHEKMKNAINETAESVRKLVDEMSRLSKASADGQLSTRGKAEQFQGSYADVVTGVNTMLDAILLPINEAAGVLEKVAARDMTARVTGDYRGDHAKIKNALNSAVDNLDQALTQVSEATEQVSSGSQQISSGSQSLAQGANEQASSLEEVSSSLEEMSSMTKQNAENANQAKNLASEANSNASVGTEAMNKMSLSINKIKESSDQTAKIVKTIDEIAMQTNLLALNAAVEAARAGEAGRGFAVVAEEVRNLAQRSAQAAKNTADMISESVKNSEEGVKIAVDVSKSFDSIAGSVKKVNDLINEIAAASQEQSQGIDQVNTAVAEMDKVTQQNAANSEESASAAEEMSSQAEELQSMVAQFALTASASRGMKTHVSAPAVAQHKAVSHLDLSKSKPADKKAVKKPASGNGHGKVSPEDFIPMNEEALKSF